jgi:Tol biopolymer transport system component
VFSASTGQAPHLHERDLATGANRALLPSGPYSLAGDFTPDGKQLLFFQRTARSNWELMTMTMGPTPTTAPLRLSSPSAKLDPRLSRDGQVLSFVSLESGSAELFVSPFPPTGKTIQVSTNGGWPGRWSHDGRELFYISSDGQLMVVSVSDTPALKVGTPRALFSLSRPWRDFVVSPDGGNLIAVVSDVLAQEQPLTAVLNWQAEIRR